MVENVWGSVRNVDTSQSGKATRTSLSGRPDRPGGTQVVARVAGILRIVSQMMPEGAATGEIAARAGLTRPTAHRLLSSLTTEGLIDRDPGSGRWMLGPEIFLMGTVAADRYDVSRLAGEHVSALARETGESAFFSARRGDETVCLLREDGSFPVRSFVLHEGRRFPLGVASAGLAILAFMPDAAVDRYLDQAELHRDYGESHSPGQIRERIAETRRSGYAVNPGLIVEGSWGMGAAVFASGGQPSWALSLTGIEHRFAAGRCRHLGALLLDHAHQLSQRLSQS